MLLPALENIMVKKFMLALLHWRISRGSEHSADDAALDNAKSKSYLKMQLLQHWNVHYRMLVKIEFDER